MDGYLPVGEGTEKVFFLKRGCGLEDGNGLGSMRFAKG